VKKRARRRTARRTSVVRLGSATSSPARSRVRGSGIAQATGRLELGTAVTCPTVRIHPAVVAQAAATRLRFYQREIFPRLRSVLTG